MGEKGKRRRERESKEEWKEMKSWKWEGKEWREKYEVGGGEGRERVGSQTENRGRDEVMGEWERKRRRVMRRRKEKMGESTYTPT